MQSSRTQVCEDLLLIPQAGHLFLFQILWSSFWKVLQCQVKKIHSGAEFHSRRWYLKDLTGGCPPPNQLYIKYLVTVKIKTLKQTLLRSPWCWFLGFIILGADWFWLQVRLVRRLTGKGRLYPEPKLEKVYTKEHLLAQCLCNSWEYGKTMQKFLVCHSKIRGDCLHLLFTESIFPLHFWSKRLTSHKHSFWHKTEIFKIRYFCMAKYSNKSRGSSNYTGANTIKTLLSRQGSTTYPSQLFHRLQRSILHCTEDNGRGFSNLKANLG